MPHFGPSEVQIAHDVAKLHPSSPVIDESLSSIELRQHLNQSREENAKLKQEVHDLKAELTRIALQYEEEDERVALGLLRKVDTIKRHEARALQEAEQESERLTNRLNRQVEQLRSMSEHSSRSFEAEQEMVLNKTKKMVLEAQADALKWKALYEEVARDARCPTF